MVNNSHNPDKSFIIYHQNINGLKNKKDELINALLTTTPHILCLSEHHLKHNEIKQINIEGFKLVTSYCRQSMKKGGVCIYAVSGLICSKIDMSYYSKDQDIEICMLKINIMSVRLHILVVYRAPTGDFNFFLNQLDDSIKSIYKTNLNLIICGDINISYLLEHDMKK